VKLYQFSVYSYLGGYGFNNVPPRSMISTYALKLPSALTQQQFTTYASLLVFAERVVSTNEVRFNRVVALNADSGKTYNSGTRTFTMLPDQSYLHDLTKVPAGLRPAGRYGINCAVNLARNRASGRAALYQLAGCLANSDLLTSRADAKNKEVLTLNMDGSFANECFHVYKYLLSKVPGHASEIEISKFGHLKEHAKIVGQLQIHTPVYNHARETSWRMASPQKIYISALLWQATWASDVSLMRYDAAMANFKHLWGDGNFPALESAFGWAQAAAYVWVLLARALGYTLPATRLGADPASGFYYPHTGPNPVTDVIITKNALEVESCIQTLYHAHQYIAKFFPYRKEFYFQDIWKRTSVPLWWTEQTPEQNAPYVYYEEYGNVFFKISDCLNVLNQILIVDNPRLRKRHGWWYGKREFSTDPPAATSPPAALEFVPYRVVTLRPKDPYLKTFRPATAVARPLPPPVETYRVDRLGPYPKEFPARNAYQVEMDDAINTARERLDQCNTGIGKVRKWFPWYQFTPLELLNKINMGYRPGDDTGGGASDDALDST
jgi:hypothetical protein